MGLEQQTGLVVNVRLKALAAIAAFSGACALGTANSASGDIGPDNRGAASARALELASKDSTPSAPLDVTGDSDLQARRDAVKSIVEKSGVADGGLIWDADAHVLTINVVETEQTLEALAALKITLASRGEPFAVEFQPVEYSRVDLEALAQRLFSSMGDWAPGLMGAGGGFDPELNRVIVSVRSDLGLRDEWSARVEQLDDPRVSMRTFSPVAEAGPQNRLDDSNPWGGDAWLHGNSAVEADPAQHPSTRPTFEEEPLVPN